MNIKNIKSVLFSLTVMACSKVDEPVVTPEAPLTAGTANFSKYVGLGDSLTAGFSDGTLFKAGQEASFPNILAAQFKLVGGGDFKQPLTNDNNGGLLFGGAQNPRFGTRLYFNGSGSVPITDAPTTEVFAPNTGGPYNNLGVPGAKSFHLLSPTYGAGAGLATGTANPFYVRFAKNGTTSIITEAVSQAPTFFSLWIGNNDVLGYATAGGITAAQDPVNGSDITPVTGAPGAGFDGTYTALITALTSGGAKGIGANIPYVNTVPYFTTVPYNPLKPSVLGAGNIAVGDAIIDALNTNLYGVLKQVFTALGEPNRIDLLKKSSASNPDPANPLLIKDEYLPNLSVQITGALTPKLGAPTAAAFGAIFGQARQATAADYVLLTSRGSIAATVLGVPASINKNGISFPFEDKLVLSSKEVEELKVATDGYNAIIKSVATSKGLAIVDANALLTQVASGTFTFGNFSLTSSYATGGAFSLDGVHPSPRGYALVANAFFKAINDKYGSALRPVDLANYKAQYGKVIN
jgi:hypothetical protein